MTGLRMSGIFNNFNYDLSIPENKMMSVLLKMVIETNAMQMALIEAIIVQSAAVEKLDHERFLEIIFEHRDRHFVEILAALTRDVEPDRYEAN